MHSPMHSFGESRTQPSTPCSHSMECGGSRSSFIGSDVETFLRRRAFFKSAAAPAASETESIMRHCYQKAKQKETPVKRKMLPAVCGKTTVSMSTTCISKNKNHCCVDD